jgi:hypothetical protein
MRRLTRTVLSTITGALLLAPAASADVLSSDYPTAAADRNLATSVGGWSAQVVYGGCAPAGPLCAEGAGGWLSPGGRDDDGYLHTQYASGLSIQGDTTVSWVSPTFQWAGAGGIAAQDVTLDVARRANVGAFLGTGGSASVTVQILRAADSSVAATLIASELVPASPSGAWQALLPRAVPPSELSQLTDGAGYKLRLSVRYQTPFSSGGASVDWDDVRLRAVSNVPTGGIASIASGRLEYFGSDDPSAVAVTVVGDQLRLSSSGISAGAGCTQHASDAVDCPAAGISAILAQLRGGDDDWDSRTVPLATAVLGGEGNDTIRTGAASDAVDGGPGNDAIDGGAGDDILAGGLGGDVIDGGAGNDLLVASDQAGSAPGDGPDSLRGGDGNDRLDGSGTGPDALDGGAGNDAATAKAGDTPTSIELLVARDVLLALDPTKIPAPPAGPGPGPGPGTGNPPGGDPKPKPPATALRLKVGSSALSRKGSSLRLRIACPRTAVSGCSARAQVRGSGRTLASGGPTTIRTGTSRTIALKTAKGQKSRVRRAQRLSVRITVRDDAGRTASRTAVLQVRR